MFHVKFWIKLGALFLNVVKGILERIKLSEAKESGHNEAELEAYREADRIERDIAAARERLHVDKTPSYEDPRNRRRRKSDPLS